MTWDQDPFSKKYRKFEKKNYGQISITGPDLDPEKIEKFNDRFGRLSLKVYLFLIEILFKIELNVRKQKLKMLHN